MPLYSSETRSGPSLAALPKMALFELIEGKRSTQITDESFKPVFMGCQNFCSSLRDVFQLRYCNLNYSLMWPLLTALKCARTKLPLIVVISHKSSFE